VSEMLIKNVISTWEWHGCNIALFDIDRVTRSKLQWTK